MIAIDAKEVEELFAQFVPRAKVRDAINALLAAREFAITHVGNRSMLTIASRLKEERPALARNKPIARRPRLGVRPK
jgi:hypothetical protein